MQPCVFRFHPADICAADLAFCVRRDDLEGAVPGGWLRQKKPQSFDPVVERRLVALPAGYRRGIVDGRAVIIDDRTHVLIDMAVVF